jgi:hypothetical protein
LESTGCTETRSSKKNWKKTVEEEAAEMEKTWKEVKRLANNRTHGDVSQMPYAPVRSDRKLVVVVAKFGIHEEIKSRFSSRNTFYRFVQNAPSVCKRKGLTLMHCVH